MFTPKGFQTYRKQPRPSGTLGSVMLQAAKLKDMRGKIKANKWTFQTGSPEDLTLYECPGCGEHSCHWIGGGPKDIECLNGTCFFFKLPPGVGKKKKPDDNNELDFYFGVDWGIGNP